MKVAMLLSGGVDSAVAMKLLRDAGHDITAFYLKIWLEDELSFLGDCPWEADMSYVRAVCEQLDVPYEVIPLQQAYFDRVVAHAVAELKAGRTPSPDIHCNSQIKFGAFFDHVDETFDRVASGHYARTLEQDGCRWLRRAPDPVKDQTYFLARLRQDQLQRACFPIGDYDKAAVRQLARDAQLPPMDRKDSQGICFLGKISYRDFVRAYLGENPGAIVDHDSGDRLGEHRGLWFHTIGQRQGLGLSGGPWYVKQKDMAANTLYVTRQRKREVALLYEFEVADVHWISMPPVLPARLKTKLRHGPDLLPCTVTETTTGLHVTLDTGDYAIAPGQYAIFYRDELCLGCGVMQ